MEKPQNMQLGDLFRLNEKSWLVDNGTCELGEVVSSLRIDNNGFEIWVTNDKIKEKYPSGACHNLDRLDPYEPVTTSTSGFFEDEACGITTDDLKHYYEKMLEPSFTPINSFKQIYAEWDLFLKNNGDKPKKGFFMSTLKKLTNFVKGLKQPMKDYYRLGWVEFDKYQDEFVVTAAGKDAYFQANMILNITLPEYAAKEIARIKKQEKSEEED